ncbi:DUF3800 domain-containing protein [Cytobacillus oceanisediminis]|uniref:DUF3800 domain-containing protein n=1 Tax=Cytobacillus oceanisediminis TaxID=665099 RepID=UPI001FB35EB1|nr:DUF3800 domain-containing protein [Cytobacillus oceanisediminis]UOE54908.1 DUF3800 domain-containing protein [Cytobacillus oceanisediminis]
MGDKLILNFDESGNLGKQGRYFTIACIEMPFTKPLSNVMKKTVLKVKKEFTRFENVDEIKASDSNPIIKDYFLRKIASKDLNIRYIVADLHHVKSKLLEDENLLYNYMLKFIIEPVAMRRGLKHLVINLDKRTIKVESTNSFENYIKIRLNYDLNLDLDIEVRYIESQNSYPIQAADFVANAINSKYEHGHNYNYDLISSKVVQSERFPRRYFGQQKVVSL